MLNYIYQITENQISSDDYLHEVSLYDSNFLGNIADRVKNNVDRNGSLLSLKERFECGQIAKFNDNDYSFGLLGNAKKRYFKGKHNKFIEDIEILSNTTEEEFLENNDQISTNLRNVTGVFCREFADYVYSDDSEPITFDEFIRSAEIGKKYFIGGIVDYHW